MRTPAVAVLVAALVALLFGGLLVPPGVARGDDALPDGVWTLSPLTEAFTIRDWGASCGTPPKSDTLIPGAQVMLRTEGAELVMSGAARPLRTDQCIDPLPTLSRTSHSSDGRSWRTSCSTAAGDPRRAIVNTAYFLTPGNGTITVGETGRYEFGINGTRCVADVSRSGTLTRLAPAVTAAPTLPAPAAPPATTATPPAAETRSSCNDPGDPARLEVRPSRKLLKLGDVFAFHGVVLDTSGCATPTAIQWTVGPVSFRDGQAHAAQPAVDAAGKLTVPAADFADATFEVIATAAGRSARAGVEVTSAANYEALLAQSGLDSNGAREEPAVAVLATTAIGASGARTEDTASRRRLVFIGIVSALALGLGVVALIGRTRARRAREAEAAAEQRHAARMEEYERAKRAQAEAHAVQMKKFQESVAIAQQQAAAAAARGIDTGPLFCLSCRREFPGGIVFCPYDANRLVTVRGHSELMKGPPGGVCPSCRRGYNPGVKTCPKDGEELVPPTTLGAPSSAAPGAQGKICPQCGDRAEGGKTFCGKDGTQLVMLN